MPVVDPDSTWVLVIEGVDALFERAHESLPTLANGRLGMRGSVLVEHPSADPRKRAMATDTNVPRR